jgi:uncharacterized protein YeaO (DUF488 family)
VTLHVQSARINYIGPDRLDVTRKSGTDGLFLAPSWKILRPALDARRRETDEPSRHMSVAWANYVSAYFDEMRRSYVDNRAAWTAILARERVVLCCYCTDPEHCHRALLRSRILPALGAVDGGEIKP